MWFMFVAAILGVVGATMVIRTSVWRGVLAGIAFGAVVTLVVNLVASKPVPCLQQSKGLDILWAYKTC